VLLPILNQNVKFFLTSDGIQIWQKIVPSCLALHRANKLGSYNFPKMESKALISSVRGKKNNLLKKAGGSMAVEQPIGTTLPPILT
jgi:hypothetical protein